MDDLPAGFRPVAPPSPDDDELPPGFRPVSSALAQAPASAGSEPSMFDRIFPKYGGAAALVNGATFGTLPEIQAGLATAADTVANVFGAGSGKPAGEFFDEKRVQQRGERRAFSERNPIGSVALEATGGLATGAGMARNGATIVGNMANRGMQNIAARTGAGAVEGGLYGAASGAGHSEGGFEDRARAAARDALVGFVLGGAAVPAVDAIASTAGRVAANGISGFRNPEEHSKILLVQAIMRDRMTPADLASRVRAAADAGQPEFAAVDAAGRNVQRLGAMAAKTPGQFRDDLPQALAARQNGQGQRIGSFVDEALGVTGPNAFQTEQGIANARRTAAQPLYDAAYSAPAPQGQFYAETLQRQSVQDAIRAAERTAAERQVPISDLFTDVPNPNAASRQVPTSVLDANGAPVMRSEVVDPTTRVPTVRGWDYVKRELDARVNQLYTAGDTTAAEAVKETRNALRSQLAHDVPDYGRALARYSDQSNALEAIGTGRDLIRARNADEARAAYNQIPENRRDLARIGASREIGAKLENMRAGQDKTQVFDTPNMQGKMETLIPDPIYRAAFNDRLARERAMVRASRQMQGGSSTYENIVDGGAVTESVLAKLASGNIGGATIDAAKNMLGFVGRATSGMTEDVAQNVGRYLMSANPDEIARLTRAYEAVQNGSTTNGQFVASLVAAASVSRSKD